MAQEIADSKLLDTWASGGNIVEPDVSKIIEGWQLGEQPPHEYMNWLQNTFGSKLNHILKNGVAEWNNETEYLAGSSVQHNGNVWLCKTINTNSEPTELNANWERIITVESLTTVLGGYVATTGNQTIAGVKTFTSSPIVPTPTTGTQAVNKDYVDNAATLNINALPEKTTPDNTDNLVIQETGGLLKKLSFANLVNWIKSFSFGWGQTWQDVTGSRVSGTTYTNSTGKPIFIRVFCKSADAGYGTMVINGVSMLNAPQTGLGVNVPSVGIVPNGATYSVTSSIISWHELR